MLLRVGRPSHCLRFSTLVAQVWRDLQRHGEAFPP